MNFIKLSKIILICWCALVLSACTAAPASSNLTTARVNRIISGQSLEIIEPQTQKLARVRIMGIDAPDLKQAPWGIASKNRLSELINTGDKVELESLKRDRFERWIAHVWHNGTLVSERLLEEGYVLANTKYPHKYSQRFSDAQEYARLLGYGIWHPQQPMRQTPRQFRAQNTGKL